jgi:hypothetical protein
MKLVCINCKLPLSSFRDPGRFRYEKCEKIEKSTVLNKEKELVVSWNNHCPESEFGKTSMQSEYRPLPKVNTTSL